MIKLPPARRIIKPQRPAFRTWVSVWLQRRRRRRASPGTGVPVITGTAWQFNEANPTYRDAYIAWTFDLGDLPSGNLEVWEHDAYNADHVVATLPIEQRSLWDPMITTEPISRYYRVRYIYGVDVTGPFSNEVAVRLYDPPAAPIILGSDYYWGASAEGYADVTLTFTFSQGSFPSSNLEVWYRVGGDGDYLPLDGVPCDAGSFTHAMAASSETLIYYKMRYTYNEVVGPFSEEWAVYIAV